MKRYVNKSSAVRAAKRMYGRDWRVTHAIYGSGNGKGTWDYGIFPKEHNEMKQSTYEVVIGTT